MFSEIVIRRGDRADLPSLYPVIERAYRGDSARLGWTHEADLLDGDRTSLTILEAVVDDPDQRLLIAWRDGTPLGCVTIMDRGDGLAYLGQLCVEPVLQAGGLGKRLIAAAEDTAIAEFDAERVEMTVIEGRAELIAFYARRGYAATGERRDFPIALDPPLFMVVLERPLRELVEG